MLKELKDIKTAKELIEHIQIHGMSTVQEDIVTMQDIIGHEPIEELYLLANDIGRNDENGNPDPKGTWSSGRKGTQSTFYSLLFHIWNWQDAVDFWNRNTNPDHEQKLIVDAQNNDLRCARDRMRKEIESKDAVLEDLHNRLKEAEDSAQRLREVVNRKDAEILALKAKLYDLMTKEEVTA